MDVEATTSKDLSHEVLVSDDDCVADASRAQLDSSPYDAQQFVQWDAVRCGVGEGVPRTWINGAKFRLSSSDGT